MTMLVYIGGYGHSGSTLLEYLLAADPQVTACGEVASVLRDGKRKGKCTCGRAAKECPVWGPFQIAAGLDGLSHERLVCALLMQDRGKHAALVDSSKTAWATLAAPFRLRRVLGDGFQLVHVVRDPRGVCWSAVTKAGRRGKAPLKAVRCGAAALGWLIANLACELFGRRYPENYSRIRYEDLARAPEASVQGLHAKLLPGHTWRAESIGTNDNRHQLYGNRMRSQALSLASIKEDLAWQSEMRAPLRWLIAPLTAPLRKRYGYR